MTTIQKTTDWLLAAETPSIAYQTRKDLRPAGSPPGKLREAGRRIMRTGAVPAILSRQSKGGNWKIDRGYYGPKFFSTHWSMVMLAELGADGKDARFQRGAEYMLQATRAELLANLEGEAYHSSCFWGNLLRYAIQAGFANDPRVDGIVQYLTLDMKNGYCTCRHNYENPCAWGAARSLWGLAVIPKRARTKEVDTAIRGGIRFLLADHRLERADYPIHPGGKVNPLWFKLNFPLFYQVDILFTLRVLDELEVLDHRGARAALDWLAARRRPDGRWKGSSPYRLRTWREMGAPPETDRWVTLQAIRILRHAGRSVE
jgi:hypothetical protein